MLERDRIKRARALISLGDSEYGDVLQTRFEDLGNELSIRSLMFRQRKNWKGITDSEKYHKLSSAFKYTSLRLSEIFVRLELLRFIGNETGRIPEADRLAEMTKSPGEGNPWMWDQYAGLAIKDFHSDISSVMDSVAPVVIQVEGEIKKDESPGFPDIQKRTERSYRKTISPDILGIIDETNRWWPAVKMVRNVMIHREHLRIVFPTLGDNNSLLFQVYEDGAGPMIVAPQLMHPGGKNVIDFSLYSASVIADLLVFLEDLADTIAHHLKIGSMTPSYRIGNFKALASSFDRLESLII